MSFPLPLGEGQGEGLALNLILFDLLGSEDLVDQPVQAGHGLRFRPGTSFTLLSS